MMDMDEIVEIVARATWESRMVKRLGHPQSWDARQGIHRHEDIEDARAVLSALSARGLAVVNRQRHEDYIAEAEDCINTIHNTLRHRQQPQDVTFHRAQKAMRDAKNDLVAARPSLKEGT